MRPAGIFPILELLKTRVLLSGIGYGIILFLTVVRTMNRCNPSIYAGYSDFGFRNEIW